MDAIAAPKLERASGNTRLSFKSSPRGTVLDELYQRGCSKVRFPRRTNEGLEAVLLNTSGGLTDGDAITNEICWRAGTRATVTTQAAERVYRAASNDVARVSTRVRVEERCVAAWLPQETIVFNGARLARTLEIDLHSSSQLVAVESTVFGRRAMGEILDSGRVSDRWRVRIDGRLAFADNFLADDQQTGPVGRFLNRASIANMAHCAATIVIVAAEGNDVVESVRRITVPESAILGASRLDRVAVVRMLATDSQSMRIVIGEIIACLGGAFDLQLPRVWHC